MNYCQSSITKILMKCVNIYPGTEYYKYLQSIIIISGNVKPYDCLKILSIR